MKVGIDLKTMLVTITVIDDDSGNSMTTSLDPGTAMLLAATINANATVLKKEFEKTQHLLHPPFDD